MKRSVLLLLLLASCTSAEKFYDSTGKEHVMVQCLNNDLVSGIESCFKKANKECPSGWSWDGSTKNSIANQQPSDYGAGMFGRPASPVKRTIVSVQPTTDFQMISITCKN
jgi:hypothetical protein